MIKFFQIYIFIAFFNSAFSQNTNQIVIIDSITRLPIENVKIYSHGDVVFTTGRDGIVTLSNTLDEIVISASHYYDIVVKNLDRRTISMLPISNIQLDEVIVEGFEGKNVIEKIRNVYFSQRNYKTNYLFKNITINLSANDKKIIGVDEMFYLGDKVRKKTVRKIETFQYQSKQDIANYEGISYAQPFSLFSQISFQYIPEITKFLEKPSNFKYKLNEYNDFYTINFNYRDKYKGFNFAVSLTIDKYNFCIVTFDKQLKESNKNSLGFLNFETNKTQYYKILKHEEHLLFEKNEVGEYELISQTTEISYQSVDDLKVNFNYKYRLKPSTAFDNIPENLVEFDKLTK